jgi:hypothetical protein
LAAQRGLPVEPSEQRPGLTATSLDLECGGDRAR